MRGIAKKLVFGASPLSVYEMEGGNLATVVDLHKKALRVRPPHAYDDLTHVQGVKMCPSEPQHRALLLHLRHL